MKTVWPIILFGIQMVSTVIAAYFVYSTDTKMPWTNASKVCQLAKPHITYTGGNEKIDIGTVRLSAETWVGYVPRFVILKYHGCYPYQTLSLRDVDRYETQLNVGVCFSACGSSYVAIKKEHTCLCLNEEIIKNLSSGSWSSCNVECDSFLCGSGNKEFMSVYGYESEPREVNSSCFTYGRNLSLESRACENKTNISGFIYTVNDEDENMCVVDTGEPKWVDTIKKHTAAVCMNSNVNGSNVGGQGGKIFWSPFIGVWVVGTNQTQATDMVHGERPKYVSFVDQKGKLHTTILLDEMYFALCENASMSTTPSLVPTTIRISKEITTTHNNVLDPFNTKTTDNTTGVYVGVGIGIVVIGTLIVVSVVLRKQIYRLVARKPKDGETIFTHVTFDNATESQTSGDVAPITQSVHPELPNYFVLEPGPPEPINKQLHQTSTDDADDESSYDMCKHNRYTDTQQPNNVYNVVEHPDIQSYRYFFDHTNLSRDRVITNGTTNDNFDSFPGVGDDHSYDVHNAWHRIQECKNQSENIYDTTGNRISDGCIYDHTVDTKARGAADENMYGHISSDVTGKDIEDTYNHI